MMLDAFGVTEDNWRDALDPQRSAHGLPVAPPDFALSESPLFVGRAVVALATDPQRGRWNQSSVSSGQLAKEYGFTDSDGRDRTRGGTSSKSANRASARYTRITADSSVRRRRG